MIHYSRVDVGREVVVELQSRRGRLRGGVQQEGLDISRSPASATTATAAKRLGVVSVEALQVHAQFPVHVLGRRE